MSKTLHLAITGNIGSGKSSACKLFRAMGIPIYSSDVEAKRLMREDTELIRAITALLGEDAYNESGLNKAFIASKIFGNKSLLEKMNALVHPAVKQDYMAWRQEQQAPFTIQESALTFEIEAEQYMDYTMVVYAPEALLIHRAMQRDQADHEKIKARLSKQMSLDLKVQKADFVIDNSLGQSMLKQAIVIYDDLIKR